MRVIRRGVFETNSSSTHSLTMVSEEDYDKWENGELVRGYEGLISRDAAIQRLLEDYPKIDLSNEEKINEILKYNGYETSVEYFEDENLESFVQSYTTKSNDKIVAFGKYGEYR